MKYITCTLSLAAACLLSASLIAQTRPTDVYVGVVDAKGEPATGLTASDFRVREDGVAREVLKAQEATGPLSISLLVDDSDASRPALQMIRDGVDTFIKTIGGKADVAIATFGDRPTPLVDYTTDQKKLSDAAHRIFTRAGAGAYLLDALIDVSKGLQKRDSPRKAIVVLAMDNDVEFSNRQYTEVLAQIDKSGATLHVIALGTPGSSQPDEMRNRNTVIAEGTAHTGGRRDNVLAYTGAAPHMQQLASELLHQYVVTYGRPETLIPPEKIEVTVGNPALTVHARTRTAQPGAR